MFNEAWIVDLLDGGGGGGGVVVVVVVAEFIVVVLVVCWRLFFSVGKHICINKPKLCVKNHFGCKNVIYGRQTERFGFLGMEKVAFENEPTNPPTVYICGPGIGVIIAIY